MSGAVIVMSLLSPARCAPSALTASASDLVSNAALFQSGLRQRVARLEPARRGDEREQRHAASGLQYLPATASIAFLRKNAPDSSVAAESTALRIRTRTAAPTARAPGRRPPRAAAAAASGPRPRRRCRRLRTSRSEPRLGAGVARGSGAAISRERRPDDALASTPWQARQRVLLGQLRRAAGRGEPSRRDRVAAPRRRPARVLLREVAVRAARVLRAAATRPAARGRSPSCRRRCATSGLPFTSQRPCSRVMPSRFGRRFCTSAMLRSDSTKSSGTMSPRFRM